MSEVEKGTHENPAKPWKAAIRVLLIPIWLITLVLGVSALLFRASYSVDFLIRGSPWLGHNAFLFLLSSICLLAAWGLALALRGPGWNLRFFAICWLAIAGIGLPWTSRIVDWRSELLSESLIAGIILANCVSFWLLRTKRIHGGGVSK